MVGKSFSTALVIISVFCFCSQADANLDAERLYESAFGLIVSGDYVEAYDRLEEIIAAYPDTVYAHFARMRRRQLTELKLPSIRRRGMDQSGRMESIVFGTLYSTWLGVGSAWLAK